MDRSKENMPEITVIMPSLNVSAFIRESVSSVLAQSLQDMEILCIDAGSTDGTWEILKELEGTDTRLQVHHSDVKSYGYQVNLGISLAKGEYIAVVETDDYIDSGMYEALYQAAKEHNCDYVKSDYFFYWTQTNGERFFIKKKMFQENSLYDHVVEPIQYPQIFSEDWYLWNGIYKRTFILQNRIRFHETPGAAFQDIGFLHRTGICAKRAFYLKEPFYRYCIDREGSSSNSGKALEYAHQEFRKLVEEEDDITDRDALRALYIRMARSFLYSYPELDWEDKDEPWEEYKMSYSWFQGQLGWAIKNHLIDRELILDETWDKLCALLVSEQHYYDRIRSRNQDLVRQLGDKTRCSIVVFGCGHYGFMACQWLKKRCYSVTAFMDNNRSLWGKTMDGILIRSPEDITLLGNDVKYCIANALYSEDIRRQILEKGTSAERIIILS